MKGYYKIGEIVKRAGVSTQKIRNDEKRGLLKPSLISEKGTRFYTEEVIQDYLKLYGVSGDNTEKSSSDSGEH